MRTAPAVLIAAALLASAAGAEEVRLPAATRTAGDVTLVFPEVVYRPPPVGDEPVRDYAAALSEALGVTVDPARDHVAEAQNRMLFRHPQRPDTLLKIYKTTGNSARVVAKLLQRDLAVAGLLERLGVPHARLVDRPALREIGAFEQRYVRGSGLDRLHPDGYRPGSDPKVDRLLDTLARWDDAVRTLVGRQLGITPRNDVDCRTVRSLGFDLGHCYANVYVEDATGEALLIDW